MTRIPQKLTGEWLSCASTAALMKLFDEAGYKARFVGGIVRNALTGEPGGDLDIATDARPQTVMALAQKAGYRAIATGIDHGTVTLVIEDRSYEVTTLRVDRETDGRHARVAFTEDWRLDALRRDFTMNALYVDGDGTLFDPLGGYEDLMAGRVRFIGSAEDRIREDYLRILRFFRFSARYGEGRLDGAGLKACTALQGGLVSLSRERVRSEFLRLLVQPHIAAVLRQMFARGLLNSLVHMVPHMSRFERWLVFERELQRSPSEMDRLGVLYMLVREDADRLASGLRLSNRERHRLAHWAHPLDLEAESTGKQARLACHRVGKEGIDRFVIGWFLSGDGADHEGWRDKYHMLRNWQPPAFPVKAADLLKKGMKPGPALGRTLRRIEERWRDSDFRLKREELLERVPE